MCSCSTFRNVNILAGLYKYRSFIPKPTEFIRDIKIGHILVVILLKRVKIKVMGSPKNSKTLICHPAISDHALLFCYCLQRMALICLYCLPPSSGQ